LIPPAEFSQREDVPKEIELQLKSPYLVIVQCIQRFISKVVTNTKT